MFTSVIIARERAPAPEAVPSFDPDALNGPTRDRGHHKDAKGPGDGYHCGFRGGTGILPVGLRIKLNRYWSHPNRPILSPLRLSIN